MCTKAKLLIVDWRRVGHTRFRCRCSSETLHVVKDTELMCEKYTCFSTDSVGLMPIAGGSSRMVVASPVLACRECPKKFSMHSAAILSQIPGKFRHAYPVDEGYVDDGFQVHLEDDLTRKLESLFIEGPTACASYCKAADQSLAQAYETAMMRWNVEVDEYEREHGSCGDGVPALPDPPPFAPCSPRTHPCPSRARCPSGRRLC